MPLEIITVLIAMFAGTAGYFFREYSSKAEPFFQILTIAVLIWMRYRLVD
jgi:hypothetical protein